MPHEKLIVHGAWLNAPQENLEIEHKASPLAPIGSPHRLKTQASGYQNAVSVSHMPDWDGSTPQPVATNF